MTDAIETTEHKGLTINIIPDFDPESPREWDNLGTILYSSSARECIGDRAVGREEMNEIMNRKDIVCLPVYAYIHSGVTINTTGFSCTWDSGQCGIIYVTYADVLKEWSRKRMSKKLRAQIEDNLRGEIATYDQYLRGDVYGYSISKKNTCETCEHTDDEVLDSCWGFYGIDYCREEAQAVADSLAKSA